MTVDQFGVTQLYPTVGGGKEWFCNWQSGALRYIANDTYDATDTDFGALVTGHGNKLSVSCGVCHQREPTPNIRLFVNGPWTNTELTIFIKLYDALTTSIQLRGRANHFGIGLEPYASVAQIVDPNPQGVLDVMSCGFGNYFARWGQATPINFVDIGIEIIHELYKTGLASVSHTIPVGDWIGYKLTTRTLANGHVKIEAYNNMNADKTTWDLKTSYDFDGTNAPVPSDQLTYWSSFTSYCTGKGDNLCPDVNNHQLFTGAGKWNLVRINDPGKIDLKYFSVREIVPF